MSSIFSLHNIERDVPTSPSRVALANIRLLFCVAVEQIHLDSRPIPNNARLAYAWAGLTFTGSYTCSRHEAVNALLQACKWLSDWLLLFSLVCTSMYCTGVSTSLKRCTYICPVLSAPFPPQQSILFHKQQKLPGFHCSGMH
jgi:hypothetical protein